MHERNPRVRRESLYARPALEGSNSVPDCALTRLDLEMQQLVRGMSGWGSKIIK